MKIVKLPKPAHEHDACAGCRYVFSAIFADESIKDLWVCSLSDTTMCRDSSIDSDYQSMPDFIAEECIEKQENLSISMSLMLAAYVAAKLEGNKKSEIPPLYFGHN